MTRYEVKIQFETENNNSSPEQAGNDVLYAMDKMFNYKNLNLISVGQISISKEEALKQIEYVVNNSADYDNVPYTIINILDKVEE